VKREFNSGNGAGVKRELRANSPADESAQKRPRRLPGRSQTWPWEASERGNGHGEHLPSSAHSWDGASPLDAAPSAVEVADWSVDGYWNVVSWSGADSYPDDAVRRN